MNTTTPNNVDTWTNRILSKRKSRMYDAPPEDPPAVKGKDPEYKKKLELSYQVCYRELTNPCPNWHDHVLKSKFIADPVTGRPRTFHEFELSFPDEIFVDPKQASHSYVFRRSHFYRSFSNRSSRIKKDVQEIWNARGGYSPSVFFCDRRKTWILRIEWK